jgi:hypothetical protein
MDRLALCGTCVALAVLVATSTGDLKAFVNQSSRAPLVLFDQAHFNEQRFDKNYAVFREVLDGDGMKVVESTAPFTRESLRPAQILVVANALGVKDPKDWFILPTPAAFTADEVQAVVDWVGEGGSLLLIVDHVPFPGANANLAAAFGFKFSNGGAVEEPPNPAVTGMPFTRAANTLKDHAITRGRPDGARIDSVATMSGCAFQSPEQAEPLLVFASGVVSLEPLGNLGPNNAPPEIRRVPVGGWHQAAALEIGQGRVVVFGEAGMFSRRREGVVPGFGIDAAQNRQLLLNVVHWLLRRL